MQGNTWLTGYAENRVLGDISGPRHVVRRQRRSGVQPAGPWHAHQHAKTSARARLQQPPWFRLFAPPLQHDPRARSGFRGLGRPAGRCGQASARSARRSLAAVSQAPARVELPAMRLVTEACFLVWRRWKASGLYRIDRIASGPQGVVAA